ncbi:LEAF RUST 10 DISEASE-RESISTANCE LOCUS RECEPTOR-LIKE PROTEIN KINASE-like 2.7 [Prunus yedoensis var. nudiflora]|uniref:non-specific serine/threonine protein kinase n=1 Tax=Prunus yedoensis var. nudiflora TaxID=2094558 RepID=A0A314Z5I0_PRUYE|nr:LEAF RUST 10 DISEASE-RESISTANCE LOCUS RECEPTOR-LIKE PROTEIN KINASE-like 2.7 [Prunus yedoensis var. nudiflora]
MKSWLFFSSPFAFFVFINIPLASSFDWYTSCSNKFNCGEITNVGFPFWGYGRPEGCGYPELNLTCSENVTTIGIMGVQYRVLKINQEAEETLKLVRDDYYDKICSPKFGDAKLNSNLFDYVSGSVDVALLKSRSARAPACPLERLRQDASAARAPAVSAQAPACWAASFFPSFSRANSNTSSSQGDVSCPKGETYGDVAAELAAVSVFSMCKSKVVIRIQDATGLGLFSFENVTELEQAVREGFEVKYKVDSAKCDECVGTTGVCGYDWGLSETVCYCPNRSSPSRNCSVTAEAIDNPVLPSAKGTSYEPK